MQRIQDVKKWKHVAAGSAMNFENIAERRLRLDVNAAGKATLFYVDGDGETTLLGLVEGRDVIEFATHGGSFSIEVADADVWVYTIDGEDVSFANEAAQTFTKIMERRTRNPDLEMMHYMMRRNQQMFMEAQNAQFQRLRAELVGAGSARAVQPAPAGDGPGAAGEPESDEQPGAGDGDKPSDGGDKGGAGKKAK